MLAFKRLISTVSINGNKVQSDYFKTTYSQLGVVNDTNGGYRVCGDDKSAAGSNGLNRF